MHLAVLHSRLLHEYAFIAHTTGVDLSIELCSFEDATLDF